MTRILERYGVLAAGALVAAAACAVLAVSRPLAGVLGIMRLDAALTASVGFLAFVTGGVLADVRGRKEHRRRLVELKVELRRREGEIERLATTDALTALYSRRYFFERLGVEFRRARRYGRALSCILLDVDGFKDVNDEHGHQFGDFVLAELALLLSGDLRESDVAARYGGDQFVILLPEARAADAVAVAERLQAALRDHLFDDGVTRAALTVSQGIASYPEHGISTPEDLVQAADAALAEAKRAGRDRISVPSRREELAG